MLIQFFISDLLIRGRYKYMNLSMQRYTMYSIEVSRICNSNFFFSPCFQSTHIHTNKSRLDTVDWNGSYSVSFSFFFLFFYISLSPSPPSFFFFDPHELSLCVVVVVEYKGYSSLLLLCVPFVRMSSPFEINTTITHPYIHEAVKQANEWMNEWMKEWINE